MSNEDLSGPWQLHTASRGIDTGDFAKRGSDADDNQRDENPTPDDDNGAAANDGVDEGGGEAVGNRGENKGHEGDLGGRAIARQLGLVAQGLEEVVGIVLGGHSRSGVVGLGVHFAGAVGGVVASHHDGGRQEDVVMCGRKMDKAAGVGQ